MHPTRCYGWVEETEAAPTVPAAAVKAAAAAEEAEEAAGAEAEATEEDDTVVGAGTARGLGCAGGRGTSELSADAAGTMTLVLCNVPARCEDETRFEPRGVVAGSKDTAAAAAGT